VLQSGIQNPITASIQTASNDPTMIDVEVGTGTYNLVADGVGGTYLELTSASYLSAGTWVGPRWGDDEPNTATYFDPTGNASNYFNGIYSVSRHVSDGSGGAVFSQFAETYGDFFAYGTPVSGAPEESIFYLTTTHPESSSEIPNGRYTYDSLVWDGVGGISLTQGSFFTGGSYYPDGTLESDASDTQVEVPAYSGNYYFDGNDNRWEWDGSGNIVFRYSGLYPSGTYITSYGDYDYYWDGNGGYYDSYNGGGGGGGECDPSGTYIGSGSGDYYTYVSEEDTSYPNGTYSYTEYADGQCGSYSDYSYSYLATNETIAVSTTRPHSYEETSWNDGQWTTGRAYPYAYLSDGQGGYYEAMHSEPTLGDFYPIGTTVLAEGYVANTFTLNLSDGTTSYVIENGTGTYTTHYIWDGNGNIMSGPNETGSFLPLGTPILDQSSNHISETYEYDDGDGNLVTGTTYYFHDGNGYYTTSSNPTYS
jgi:hypothetical protein